MSWKTVELEYLLKNYSKKTAKEIAIVLDKSPRAIHNKAYRIGLNKPRVGWNKGKPMSLEAKRKMIASKKGKVPPCTFTRDFKGNKNPNYRGGKPVPCEVCGKKFYLVPSRLKTGKCCSRECIHILLIGEKHSRWKGGRSFSSAGYVLAWNPFHPFSNNNGYVMEHRLVVEKDLGRYLKPKEVVHHIDGNKENNTKKNLQLFPNSKTHSKFHAGCSV